MSKVLVKSNTIIPSTQIIDYFNGKYMFYIENPFFKVPGVNGIKQNEFLTYKKIDNGTELKTPKIYYKYNNVFTDSFLINISEKDISCRFFGPFTKNTKEEIKPKSNNKFLVNFDKYSIDHDLQAFLILNQQLSIALEFLMISKLLNIEITHEDTDQSFINKFCDIIKIDHDNSDIKEILDTITESKLIPVVKENETTETNLCFFDKFKSEILKYVKDNFTTKNLKTNPIIMFYGGKNDSIYSASSVKPALTVVKTIKQNESGEETETFNNVSGKFGFVLKLKGGKNDFYATKIIENKKPNPLMYDTYMGYVESRTRKSCKFVISIGYDIRRFGSGPLVCTKINAEQCVIKDSKLVIETFLIDDDEENETQNTIDMDANPDDFLN